MLQDSPTPVRVKLAALWAALMLCYIYCDYFQLFMPGQIQSLMDGKSPLGPLTPLMLLGFSVMMSVPALMVYLTVALPARASRIASLAVGIFFTGIMLVIVPSLLGDAWAYFYLYYALVEIILSLVIVVTAWRWPRAAGE